MFAGFDGPLPLGFNNALWSNVLKVVGEVCEVTADGGGVDARFVEFAFDLDPASEDVSWFRASFPVLTITKGSVLFHLHQVRCR